MAFLLVAFCATLAINHATASEKENLTGTWKYKAPTAPYEFSEGELIFGETDGQTTLTLKFMNGAEIKAQNVKVEKEDVSFGLEIESATVTFTGKLVEGKITGKVDSPDGSIELTAEKKQ